MFKRLLILFCVLAGFFFIKTYQPSMKIVYPEQCSFLIDEQFSMPFQQELQTYAQQQYQVHKDPQYVIQDISFQFPEIVSADAYVCKTDKLCFSFDAAKPIFMLNNTSVICDNQQVIDKSHYRDDVIHDLHDFIIKSSHYSMHTIIPFLQKLPVVILQDFIIEWMNDQEVVVQQKGRSEKLLFSLQRSPTEKDVEFFKVIQSEINKKKQRKRVYDFRFNNQVIVK